MAYEGVHYMPDCLQLSGYWHAISVNYMLCTNKTVNKNVIIYEETNPAVAIYNALTKVD